MSEFPYDLHEAVENGDHEQVTRILAQGVDVNARGEDGRTALHYAAKSGHPKIVDQLIKNGADPNLIDDVGYSPIAMGIGEQTAECEAACKMLKKRGAHYGLTEAAAMGDLRRVKKILRDDPAAVKKVPSSYTLLCLLVYVGNYGEKDDRYEILRLLTNHGLDAKRADVEKLLKSNVGGFASLLRDWLRTQAK